MRARHALHAEPPRAYRWRASALWRAPAPAGLYSAGVGPAVDFAAVEVFAELDDAKRWRAEMLQRHGGVVVDIVSVESVAGRARADGPAVPRHAAGAALAMARARWREVAL